jgi:signal transduction histidine kinase
MSLRSKILCILFAVVALYAAVDNGVLRFFSNRFFESWEQAEGDANLERVLATVDEELDDLAEKGRIWAGLDTLRTFVDRPTNVFREDTLGPRALESTSVDVFYVCAPDGTVRWGLIRDPETGEAIKLTHELPSGALRGGNPLVLVKAGAQDVRGVMMTSRLPLLVVTTPISDGDGRAFAQDAGTRFRDPLYGTVILGRFLDDELREKIGRPSNIEIEVRRPEELDLGGPESDLVARLTAGEERVVSFVNDEGVLHLFAALNDLRTLEPLLVQGIATRDIVALGRKATNYALLSTFASALLILFVLLRLLQRIVLVPLSTLTTKAIEIGKTDDATIRVGLERDDELGLLATEFDRMLERLAASRAEVVKTARKAGMSEIATGVLHNVGNVLNSVNVSASLVQRGAEKLSVKDLEMMVSVLRENQEDLAGFIENDPRGKHFLPFLLELSNTLVVQRKGLLAELENLGGGIDHISDLVRSQQTYAGAKGVFEYATLADEIDAAYRICSQALGGLHDIEVRREYEDLPSVKVDKHKLMEILVNLIQNAHQAIRDNGEEKVLTLRLLQPSEAVVRIEVEDSGVGIPEENLARVFNHGFTTKKNGHGFGLHVSANAATEMNGSLQVRSEGAGQGATFFLDLPSKSQETATAA